MPWEVHSKTTRHLSTRCELANWMTAWTGVERHASIFQGWIEFSEGRCETREVRFTPIEQLLLAVTNALRTTRSTFIHVTDSVNCLQYPMQLEGIDHIAMGVR